MRIWFDTEFYEANNSVQLISIGLVREDGTTLYLETVDAYYLADRTDWLRENVRPHLTGAPSPPETMRKALVNFCGSSPEFWAYYADYDWVALCQLFGTMMDLPQGWPKYCRDLKQHVDTLFMGYQLPIQATSEHSALADAVWCKEAWEYAEISIGNMSFAKSQEPSKVVRLDGKPVPDGRPVVDEPLVEILEGLVRDAKAGELTSFALATISNGEGATTAYHRGNKDSSITLIGAATRLLHNINLHADSKEE